MDDVVGRVKGVFWNPAEKRLRAPFRVPAALGLFLLAAQLIIGVVRAVTGVVSLPGPVTTALLGALVLGAIAGITWFVDRRTLADVGLSPDRRWWMDLAAGLVVGLGMVAAVVVVLRLAGLATVGGPHQPGPSPLRIGASSPAVSLLYGLLFFAVVGVLEEVIVRGYLLVNVAEGLRGYVGSDRRAVVTAIGATAGLFGVLHAANPGGTVLSLVNITLAGLLLGLAYAVTDRLAFPVGLHVTWNFGLGPVFGLPVSGLTVDTALVAVREQGPDLVTGGSFGPEGGLVMLVALAFGAGTLVWWTRRRYGDFRIRERIAEPDLWVGDGDDS